MNQVPEHRAHSRAARSSEEFFVGVSDDLWHRHITRVLFLNNLATHSPALYEELRTGNTARREALEEAQQVNARLRAAWMTHPRCQVIDGPFTIAEAVDAASRHVRELLNSAG